MTDHRPPKTLRVGDSDRSRGWEANATTFTASRSPTIGVATVSAWAARLPVGGAVLDLGCGFGEPHGRQLLEGGVEVFGIDASPTLASECRRRFPAMTVACEAVEDSSFFGRRYDGIIAIGLVFLLEESVQRRVLSKAAAALADGGRLLFTAPWQVCDWGDQLTGRASRSLGRQAYVELLGGCGITLVEELTDEGGNHYYHFVRETSSALRI
jgi:SAM-dependent methyltransferase